MEILDITLYLDGGTIGIQTNHGAFCIDRRIGTETKGKLYRGYPKSDNSNICNDAIKDDILTALIEERIIKDHKELLEKLSKNIEKT